MAKNSTKQSEASAKRAKTKADKEEAKLVAHENNRLARELEDLRKCPKSTPRYTYQVGEEVNPRTAFWNNVIIKEVLDNGQILLCEIHGTNHNYGNPIPTVDTRYLSHLDLVPKSVKQNSDLIDKSTKRLNFSQRGIESLLITYYGPQMDNSPVYQRELCWTVEDKQDLIDSVFQNMDIGKFVLVRLPYSDNGPSYEVLDGKQRINALIEFYEEKYTYKGKYFSELSRNDKLHFERYSIAYAEADEKWTLADKMNYFLKVNKAGVPQSVEHLEKVAQMLKKEQSK